MNFKSVWVMLLVNDWYYNELVELCSLLVGSYIENALQGEKFILSLEAQSSYIINKELILLNLSFGRIMRGINIII